MSVRSVRTAVIVNAYIKTIRFTDRILVRHVLMKPGQAFLSHARPDFTHRVSTLSQVNDTRKVVVACDGHVVQGQPTPPRVSRLDTPNVPPFLNVVD